jgi:hypothetical protein
VSIQHDTQRAPFAAHTTKSDKRRAGRTEAFETQLEVRSGGNDVDEALKAWIYERLGRQLGKFAPQIERIQVRFGDDNGPKGGLDKCCLVHIILSKLPPVVVEMRGETEREAFDLAAGRAERATRRNLERHGFSTKHHHKKHGGVPMTDGAGAMAEEAMSADGMQAADGSVEEGGMYGGREGHRRDQLESMAERPEKVRRDLPVDTSEPGVSANDRKAGYGHTAKRNTKLNQEGMVYALEDSTNGRPSRKSSRGGTNRSKPENPLTRRTKAAVQSPQSQAARAITRGQ